MVLADTLMRTQLLSICPLPPPSLQQTPSDPLNSQNNPTHDEQGPDDGPEVEGFGLP